MALNVIPESQAPTGPATGFGASMSQLFSNPNFLNLLAGMGAKMDPEGAGGIIGIPTQQFIANTAAQKAGAKNLAASKELSDSHKQLISALGGLKASDLTPAGTPGVRSTKTNPDGSVTLIVDPHPTPAPGPNDVESLISDNASAYPDTSLTDTQGRKLYPKLTADTPVADQVSDLLSPWLPRNPTEVSVNNEQNTGTQLDAQQTKASIQPASNLERPAQLALDSYRALDAPTRSRIHRAVEAALVQNPSLTQEELLGLIGIESHYRPNAVGPVTREGWSAKGLMQLSPGVMKTYGVTDPHNIEMNIQAGAAEFARLKAKYGPEIALAAYNAGEGAVAKYNGRVPNYPETQAYVRNVPALSAALVNLANGTGANGSVPNVDVGTQTLPTGSIPTVSSPNDGIASSPAASNGNVSATPDIAAQVQDLISTAVDTSGVKGAPRSNLITADDLRGLDPTQINAIVGRAQENDKLAVQIAELTGQTVREIRKDLNARQLEMRKAKLSAAKDISESTMTQKQQNDALAGLKNATNLESVLELAIGYAGLPKAANVGTDREAIASELFGSGVKYGQLDSKQQARVNAELLKRNPTGTEVVSVEGGGTFLVDKITGKAFPVKIGDENDRSRITQSPMSVAPGATQTVPTGPVGNNPVATTPLATTPAPLIPTDEKPSLAPGAILPGKPGAKPTEDQAKSLNFGTRALQANDIISNLEARGETGTSTTLAFLEGLSRVGGSSTGSLATAGGVAGGALGAGIGGIIGIVGPAGSVGGMLTLAVPGAAAGAALASGALVGSVLLAEPIANMLRTPEQQQYFQAKADFVGAILRKESGAAISTAEYEREEMRYFPRPSDSPEVMNQKANARVRALQSLEKESGQKMLPPNYDARNIDPARQASYYREHFKGMDAEAANMELIKNIYSNVRPAIITGGVQAYKDTYNADPRYLPYAPKVLTPNLVEQTPTMRVTLMNKIRDFYTPQIANGASDAWLIVLDGIKPQQLESFSIPQRAAIRGRMKALGLPRKVASE